jgi:polar amino acid transport system substrate-binding protein
MRLVKVFVAALVALLISSMGLAAPAAANVDQCAPPGVESASALPTNLAKAATGPGADRYTTATVEPLTVVNINALGLSVPGTLTVGTLSDAPPSICINSAGQFTGFDNELLRAIADRLGLNINFVGTEFSGLLAQVASRRFDVGSSSITTTDARRRTVGFTNGYDFVTHEMGFARSTSNAVVFMDHGQVVESGPPEQIFETAETDRLRRFLSQVL